MQRIDADASRLRQLLRSHPATRALCAGALSPLDGGLSNRAWRVDDDGASWFARLASADAERLGVDRRGECALHGAMAAAGLAPDVVVCDAATGLLVTQFISGRTWQAEQVADESNLVRLGELLGRVHAVPAVAGMATVSYTAQAQRLAAAIGATDSTATILRRRAAVAFERIERRASIRVPCHHDLHHRNVLDDGARLWLVDWEYGGLGDPLFDIAGVLALHDLEPSAAEILIGAYGRMRPSDRAVLDEARHAFDYVQWLWYRNRLESGPDPGGVLAERAAALASRLLRCNN